MIYFCSGEVLAKITLSFKSQERRAAPFCGLSSLNPSSDLSWAFNLVPSIIIV